VLILCPTRELAMQAAEEIRKVARFKTGIRPVEIYGGAAIDKQCIRLRRANIVVGTPGRGDGSHAPKKPSSWIT
jgi:ATP-dependent RNA helicase DeaD